MSNEHRHYRDLLRTIDQSFAQANALLSPIPIRIDEKKDAFIIEAELPGVEKEQIVLDVNRRALRIRVKHNEKSEYRNDEKKIVQEQVRSHVRERVIPLPFAVDEKQIQATYRNGLLRITIPNKRKRILIE